MARVSVLPAADRDVDEQAAYLARHASAEVALRFLDAMEQAFAYFASHPGVGVLYESKRVAAPGLRIGRVDGFDKHLIFYRLIDDGIEIVRVLHGHRDIGALL